MRFLRAIGCLAPTIVLSIWLLPIVASLSFCSNLHKDISTDEILERCRSSEVLASEPEAKPAYIVISNWTDDIFNDFFANKKGIFIPIFLNNTELENIVFESLTEYQSMGRTMVLVVEGISILRSIRFPLLSSFNGPTYFRDVSIENEDFFKNIMDTTKFTVCKRGLMHSVNCLAAEGDYIMDDKFEQLPPSIPSSLTYIKGCIRVENPSIIYPFPTYMSWQASSCANPNITHCIHRNVIPSARWNMTNFTDCSNPAKTFTDADFVYRACNMLEHLTKHKCAVYTSEEPLIISPNNSNWNNFVSLKYLRAVLQIQDLVLDDRPIMPHLEFLYKLELKNCTLIKGLQFLPKLGELPKGFDAAEVRFQSVSRLFPMLKETGPVSIDASTFESSTFLKHWHIQGLDDIALYLDDNIYINTNVCSTLMDVNIVPGDCNCPGLIVTGYSMSELDRICYVYFSSSIGRWISYLDFMEIDYEISLEEIKLIKVPKESRALEVIHEEIKPEKRKHFHRGDHVVIDDDWRVVEERSKVVMFLSEFWRIITTAPEFWYTLFAFAIFICFWIYLIAHKEFYDYIERKEKAELRQKHIRVAEVHERNKRFFIRDLDKVLPIPQPNKAK